MSSGTAVHLLDAAPVPDPGRPRPAVARVLQGAGANLILFAFAPGQSLPEHRAAHPITVQCLRGTLDFTWGGRTERLDPGTVVHLPAHVTHRVDRPDVDASNPRDGEISAVLLLTMLTGAPETVPHQADPGSASKS